MEVTRVKTYQLQSSPTPKAKRPPLDLDAGFRDYLLELEGVPRQTHKRSQLHKSIHSIKKKWFKL
ncbi:hypothetical protein HDU91_002979, partial [Kappamyces sp. JEL0680]